MINILKSNCLVDKRFISEGGRLISGILEITDLLKIKDLLLTVDIVKAFDSVEYQVLINLLKTFRFELCIINEWITKNYFKLERGTLQENSISTYLFILVLHVVFPLKFLTNFQKFLVWKWINHEHAKLLEQVLWKG